MSERRTLTLSIIPSIKHRIKGPHKSQSLNNNFSVLGLWRGRERTWVLRDHGFFEGIGLEQVLSKWRKDLGPENGSQDHSYAWSRSQITKSRYWQWLWWQVHLACPHRYTYKSKVPQSNSKVIGMSQYLPRLDLNPTHHLPSPLRSTRASNVPRQTWTSRSTGEGRRCKLFRMFAWFAFIRCWGVCIGV